MSYLNTLLVGWILIVVFAIVFAVGHWCGIHSSFHKKLCDYIVDALDPGKAISFCETNGFSDDERRAVIKYAHNLIKGLKAYLETSD